VISLLVVLLLLPACGLGVHGCAPAEKEKTPEKPRIVVSILPQAEFAEKVGGDKVEVVVMIPPGANPRTYEPTPGQLIELSSARIYAKVGAGLPFERVWMEKMQSVNQEMLVVDCAEGIEIVDNDPHIWLSPGQARTMVANIARGLVQIDPHSRAYYARNRDAYLRELDDLDRQIVRSLEGMQVREFMVYHPAWGYFARTYGLEQIPVEAEGKHPTVQSLARLVQQARKRDIRVVFASPQFDARSAETIAAEIGGQVIMISPLERNYVENLRQVADHLANL